LEIFRSDFRKIVFWCFWAPHAEKRQKHRSFLALKGNDDRKKGFSQLFWPKVFDMDFPQKSFYDVFEPPLLRNAQKRHKTNLKKKRKKRRCRGALFPAIT
jgi:hypothetical protein